MPNVSTLRRTAIVAGLFYLATEVTSIPALLLHQPVLRNGNYIAGANADNSVLLGGFFELLLVVACIGSAVTLYPVVKRQSHSIALRLIAAGFNVSTITAISSPEVKGRTPLPLG
ncbi:DUF4386 family protein [Kribbella capetownensis]|uniref:DUF4386 family protein n=1 Tax=Kribbella capetownensis TaxID=1572659 RepID=UPI0013F3B0A9|nr:DUF4386 family protein [Kribbella capetownensis]